MIMKKNTKIHIPISSELKERLQQKASECGLSLAQYCLYILSNSKLKTQIVE